MENKDPVALVGDIKSSMEEMKVNNEKIVNGLKDGIEKTDSEVKASVEKLENLAETQSEISANILEMQQQLASDVNEGKASVKTLGDIVTESEEFTSFAQGSSSRFTIQANTIIGQDGTGGSDDTLVPTQRLAGIIPGTTRALRIRDVIPSAGTTSNAIEYARELAFVNNAAETAEAAQKPESDLTFELVSTPVRTVAHFIKTSKQILDDATALRGYIDTRMRYGVDLRFDEQLLAGDGVGQNLSGMTNAGNFTAFAPTAGETALDGINRAIEAVELADYSPDAIIMHPTDWHMIERLKVDDAVDGRYLVGNPVGVISKVLWGLPVVVTRAMPVGKFMIGAMSMAYQVWNREGVQVQMFEQDADNVQKNLLTIRAEARAALAVYRPASAFYGDLTA